MVSSCCADWVSLSLCSSAGGVGIRSLSSSRVVSVYDPSLPPRVVSVYDPSLPLRVVSVYDQSLSAIAGSRTPRLFLPLVPAVMSRPTHLPPDRSVCRDCFYTVTERSLRCLNLTLGLRTLLHLRRHRQALVVLFFLLAG